MPQHIELSPGRQFFKLREIVFDCKISLLLILWDIIVDIHAEATSEKKALFYAFAGKVDAIVGSHTHIKTDDAQTYNNTCYITDMGMCGPKDSVLGDDPEAVIQRFLSGVFEPLPVANSNDYILSGVILDLGTVNKIEDFKFLINNYF